MLTGRYTELRREHWGPPDLKVGQKFSKPSGLSCEWGREVSRSEILAGLAKGQLEAGGPGCHISASGYLASWVQPLLSPQDVPKGS